MGARAHEEFKPERDLESLDRLTERGLCDTEPPGGSTEVEILGHGDEVTKMMQLDGHGAAQHTPGGRRLTGHAPPVLTPAPALID
jgi:hypothetical protein